MATSLQETSLQELVAEANAIMEPEAFADYCPNGLQVEGRAEVRRIVSGVTASQAMIDAAVNAGADVLLVHHGFFWRGEDLCVKGMKRRRLQRLLESGISLVAYHLPLDAHPVLGNNAQLAKELGFVVESGLDGSARPVGNVGRLSEPMTARDFAAKVASVLGREPLLEEVGEHPIHRIAWCTGAAQSYIDRAAELGVDAYLSGEVSEPTIHSAREQGLHYIAAGHHATERYGVRALGAKLAETLGIEHQFIDVDNPV
ncbi:Nif3-like dinuclear metal center hexameric protein [Spongiibacter marinus]|uniref:Nif3-like dinuclear metal center hexameric protein n=1 Tax=Spongiibacter marinus TaxID=354246 RepID=UPI003B848427|nr:dinuclear metal center YbgI/SA1388 family protein [Spongiibacter marinus]